VLNFLRQFLQYFSSPSSCSPIVSFPASVQLSREGGCAAGSLAGGQAEVESSLCVACHFWFLFRLDVLLLITSTEFHDLSVFLDNVSGLQIFVWNFCTSSYFH
jgi:hypothetical protein